MICPRMRIDISSNRAAIALFLPLLAAIGFMVVTAAATARSQEVTDAAAAAPVAEQTADASSASERWLLLCCGLPGDPEHRERLTNACRQIAESAPRVLGVAPERLLVLAGDEEMQAELDALEPEVGLCTAESIDEAIGRLAAEVPSRAACWVILLGHAHLQGDRSQFNISGPDIDQSQFAAMTEPLRCREQVFVLTFPVSGFWTSPLAAAARGSDSAAGVLPPRAIITATEADLEFTATEYPYALADVLAGDSSHASLEDIDGDGGVNLLDLYLAASIETNKRFTAAERLATEHAQLEDNGDGRSSELQQAYLEAESKTEAVVEADAAETKAAEAAAEPAEAAAAAPAPPIILRENLDGYRSRQIPLRKQAG